MSIEASSKKPHRDSLANRGVGRSVDRDNSIKYPNFKRTGSELNLPIRQSPNGSPVSSIPTGT